MSDLLEDLQNEVGKDLEESQTKEANQEESEESVDSLLGELETMAKEAGESDEETSDDLEPESLSKVAQRLETHVFDVLADNVASREIRQHTKQARTESDRENLGNNPFLNPLK